MVLKKGKWICEGSPHLDDILLAGASPGDLEPIVPDLPDQKEAEDKQIATAPGVPAAVVLGEQTPHWLPLRSLEWSHHSTGTQQ
jgi:hypothetical protein